jgi:hypothetical protein
MAKISANGATEVARVETRAHGYKYTWVMCSDGRVLRKNDSASDGGYTLFARAGKDKATEAHLKMVISTTGQRPAGN